MNNHLWINSPFCVRHSPPCRKPLRKISWSICESTRARCLSCTRH
jgi:hypothetical protein